MEKDVADRILNCLECGIVPIDDVALFSAGREKEISLINKLLDETASGESGLLFVHGDYGIGKTHILALTKNNALKRKFIVSHVTLTSRECPLSHIEYVYSNILKDICFESQRFSSGFYSFLDLWFGLVEERVLKHKNERCKHDLTYQTCGFGCLDELYGKYIPELWEVYPDFRNALKLYQHADLRDNEHLRDLIIRWLVGERITKTDLKWASKQIRNVEILDNIGSDNAFLMLKNISKFSQIIGFKGFVSLLDEAERIPSIRDVVDGYTNLIRFIIESLTMPGVCFVYATTPQFYDDAKRYFKFFESNEENKEFLEKIYRRMENERLKLSFLPYDELEAIARKIFDIYFLSKGIHDNEKLASKWEKISGDMKNICEQQQTIRDFIERIIKTIKMLDK